MAQPELPRFVFLSDEEEYHTGEIVAWMPEHCLIRMDCLHEHSTLDECHPLFTRLFLLSDLASEDTLFFTTRDELNLWLAYIESGTSEEAGSDKSVLN